MPTPFSVDVFTSGQDGYHSYRIPAIEEAGDGFLLAFAEGRKYNLGDPGYWNNEIDLVFKRSVDGGRTWSPMVVIEHAGEQWCNANPTAVADRQTGRVWIHYGRCKPGVSGLTARSGTDDILNLARYTDDGGASWSEPVDLTPVCRDLADRRWRSTVAGPGGGIQDRRGRLIVPYNRCEPHDVFTVFSDDHGQTWQRGGFVPGITGGNEDQLVELADGRILVDFRQRSGPNRWLAISDDGGCTWSAPRPGQKATPVCCAIERSTLQSAGDDRNRIVWTGPKGPDRANLVVRISYDEAETFPDERAIADEPAAYSDLARLRDKSIGVLWERGDYRYITFTRLERDFLDR